MRRVPLSMFAVIAGLFFLVQARSFCADGGASVQWNGGCNLTINGRSSDQPYPWKVCHYFDAHASEIKNPMTQGELTALITKAENAPAILYTNGNHPAPGDAAWGASSNGDQCFFSEGGAITATDGSKFKLTAQQSSPTDYSQMCRKLKMVACFQFQQERTDKVSSMDTMLCSGYLPPRYVQLSWFKDALAFIVAHQYAFNSNPNQAREEELASAAPAAHQARAGAAEKGTLAAARETRGGGLTGAQMDGAVPNSAALGSNVAAVEAAALARAGRSSSGQGASSELASAQMVGSTLRPVGGLAGSNAAVNAASSRSSGSSPLWPIAGGIAGIAGILGGVGMIRSGTGDAPTKGGGGDKPVV